MEKQLKKNESAFETDPETGEEIQVKATLNPDGSEVLDPVPLAPPINYQKPFDMFAHMQNLIRSEHVRLAALEAGAETFEESDDFEIGDDYDPSSPHEEHFDPVGEEVRQRLRQADYRAKVKAQYDALLPTELKNGDNQSIPAGKESADGGAAGASGKSKPVGGKDKKTGVQDGIRGGSESDPLDD